MLTTAAQEGQKELEAMLANEEIPLSNAVNVHRYFYAITGDMIESIRPQLSDKVLEFWKSQHAEFLAK